MAIKILFGRCALAVLFFAAVGAAAVVPFAVTRASAEEVKIDNFTFNPPELTVKSGATVTWTNADDIPHTVVAKELQFRSKALDTDDKYAFTFTTPGVYEYFCSLHPHMVGKIIVQAATGDNAAK
jgi:amicyanin